MMENNLFEKQTTIQVWFNAQHKNDSISNNNGSFEYRLVDIYDLFKIPDLFALLSSDRKWSFYSQDGNQTVVEQANQLIKFLKKLAFSKKRLSKKMEIENGVLKSEDEIHIKKTLVEFSRMNSGGKFFRGTLVNIGYSLFADSKEEFSDDLALAYELFQTSILIHDDIIDHAKLRRNQRTIPESYMDIWEQKGNLRNQEMIDTANAMALCGGDYGLFLSIQKIVLSYGDTSCLPYILNYFIDVVLKTIKGEIIDVILPYEEKYFGNKNNDISNSVFEIYRLKTAWYTVIGPICAGALLSGCEKSQLDVLEVFSECLGIAFQIKDDIIGIFNSEETIGKDIGSDIAEFKATILYAYVKTHKQYLLKLLDYYGKTVDANSLDIVKNIFISSGALSYAEETMNDYLNKAIEILKSIDFLSEDRKDLLYGMIWYLKGRTY